MRTGERSAQGWQARRDDADGGQPRADDWRERVDIGELLPPIVRPDGTLLVKGYAAREGILHYRNADGTIRKELVLGEMLQRTAPTLTRATVTLEHPREDVTPDNVARHGVGDVDGRAVVYDDGFNEVSFAVRRRDAINAVKAGKVGLSPGYRVLLDETPGVHPVHGAYDAVQIDRQYNHLAIVSNPRGGAAVRLRADGLEPETFIARQDGATTPTHGGGMNPALTALAATLGIVRRVDESDESLADRIGELFGRKDDEHSAALDALKAERDQAAARADGAEARLKLHKEQEAARKDAADRDALAEMAASHKVDAKAHATAPALRRAIAIAARPKLFEGVERSDAYVETLIEVIRDEALSTPTPRNDAGDPWRKPAPVQSPNRNDARRPMGQTETSLQAFGRPSAARGE